jgi:hypothetical protein
MPMKGSGEADDWREIDRFAGGVGWVAYPDERMERASHALVADGDVWLVDPVDVSGLEELLEDLGTVRGVVLLLDRHKRDAGALANRHDVSVWVPEFFDGVADDLSAPVERFRHDLGDSGFAAHTVVDRRFWQEAMLYDHDREVMVVAEAVGTPSYFRAGEERLGVHPMMRLTPPRKLTRLEPDRILLGHGPGIHEDATEALEDAVDGSRTRAPRLAMQTVRSLLPV